MLQMLNNQNTALQQQQNQMNFLMQAQSAQLTLLTRRFDGRKRDGKPKKLGEQCQQILLLLRVLLSCCSPLLPSPASLSPKAGKMPCWNRANALCFTPLSFQAVHSPILVKAFLVALPQPVHHSHRDRHLAWWHRLCSFLCSNCPCAACILGDKYSRIVADSKECQHSASPNQHIAVEKLVYWQTIVLSCK